MEAPRHKNYSKWKLTVHLHVATVINKLIIIIAIVNALMHTYSIPCNYQLNFM